MNENEVEYNKRNNFLRDFDIIEFACLQINKIPAHYIKIFLIVLFVNLLAYGYLFFEYIYTNHTFPNIYQHTWPSYRTQEGRWTADFLYMLFGGAGIPLLNLIVATCFQIINGIIFAKLINKTNNLSLFISATIISTHPFILDYYGFGGDHLIFVLGDFFILLAFMQNNKTLIGIIVSAFLIQLGLSCYQPKISIIATLFVILSLNKLFSWDGTKQYVLKISRDIVSISISILIGVLIYLFILKSQTWYLDVSNSGHFLKRTYINNWSEILHAFYLSLNNFKDRLFFEDSFIFSYSQAFLGIILFIFLVTIVIRFVRIKSRLDLKIWVLIMLILGFMMLPFAIYSAFIISKNSYWDSGRFFTTFPYLTVFVILTITQLTKLKYIQSFVILITIFYIYNFIITNAKSTHIAYLRTTHELQFANRIVNRIENVIDGNYDIKYHLVIFGDIPNIPQLMLRKEKSIMTNVDKKGFIFYRQVEFLNYLLGKNMLVYPIKENMNIAQKYAETHKAWPSKESVTVIDDMVIVLLEKPGKGVSKTMTITK